MHLTIWLANLIFALRSNWSGVPTKVASECIFLILSNKLNGVCRCSALTSLSRAAHGREWLTRRERPPHLVTNTPAGYTEAGQLLQYTSCQWIAAPVLQIQIAGVYVAPLPHFFLFNWRMFVCIVFCFFFFFSQILPGFSNFICKWKLKEQYSLLCCLCADWSTLVDMDARPWGSYETHRHQTSL